MEPLHISNPEAKFLVTWAAGGRWQTRGCRTKEEAEKLLALVDNRPIDWPRGGRIWEHVTP